MLEIKNIHKSFGEQVVLRRINMAFEQGKIHTIIGGNGAGKKVHFNIITDFLRADNGEPEHNKRLRLRQPYSRHTALN